VTEINPREFGRLEAEVAALTKTVEDMAKDMKAVRSTMDAAGGGWKVLVATAGLTSAVTATIIKVIPLIPFR
jgi:hypothetical protein